jgi:tetratricopeptide (TPR) repeat protein
MKKPMTPESLARQALGLDRALVVVTLVLAFLLGSFAARNTDLWLHLASGRLLAHGDYHFGHDPFTYTCPDSRWVNHAWLWDLSQYALFTVAGGEDGQGGAALVVLKALLVTLLAAVLIATRRRDLSLWAPAACTALAILVLSPRVWLRPIVVSLLFLGLTLYLLQRPRAALDSTLARWTNGRRWLLFLPPLFWLWANLDSWFFLGPLTLFLYLGAEALQLYVTPGVSAEATPQPRDLGVLAGVGVLGLVACLLNPHGVEVFTTPPPELAAFSLSENVRNEIGYKIYEPFGELVELIQEGKSDFFTVADANNVAGWSYFVLLLLGLVSFVLNLEGWTWWRALIWLAFALLSAFHARTIPFFAVVAGPITALNLQDFAVRRFGTVPRTEDYWPLLLLGGRVLTLVAGVVLLLAAWPGWLHARFDEPRSLHRVAWTVEPNPSLKAAAMELHALREQGALGPDDRGFNFTPDLAEYWAWYCPEEKGFFDHRFQLSPEMAQTYVNVRHALPNPRRLGEAGVQPIVWQRVFEQYHVRYLTLYKGDKDAQPVALYLWAAQPERRTWTLVYLDGQTFTFGWNPDPRKPSPWEKRRLDVDQMAFGKAAQPLGEPSHELRAPQRGEWYEHFWKASAPRPASTDEALMYLTYYRLLYAEWNEQWNVYQAILQKKRQRIGLAWTGGHVVGLAATDQGPVQLVLSFQLDYRAFPPVAGRFLQRQVVPDAPSSALPTEMPGLGPPGAPLLAVRAARRAIDVNPDDAEAYEHLNDAYFIILGQEDTWGPRPFRDRKRGIGEETPRSLLRDMQRAAALQHLLILKPESHRAHALLAEIFHQRGFLDMEVDQYREALKYREEGLSDLSEQEQAVAKQQAEMYKARLKELEPVLETQKDQYVNDARNQPAKVKFTHAQRLGLTQEALNILEGIDATELKKEDVVALTNILLELYLRTGQVDKAREIIKSANDLYKFYIAAVDGDYPAAAKHLDAALTQEQQYLLRGVSELLRHQSFAGSPEGLSLQNVLHLVGHVGSFRHLADLHSLGGILALEQGDIKAAKAHFEAAQQIAFSWKPLLTSAVTPLAGPSPLTAAVGIEAALQNLVRPGGFHYDSERVVLNYQRLLRAQE